MNPAKLKSAWITGPHNFRREILECLKEGYGVDDIAVAAECSADLIRSHVAILRKAGRLNFGGNK